MSIYEILITLANLILIVFNFSQWRQSKKPIIYTKFLSYDKAISSKAGIESKSDVLEDCSKGSYLVISNESEHNIAENVKINYSLKVPNHPAILLTKSLPYLNPKEATKILVTFNEIVEQHKELFDVVKPVKVAEYTLPKTTMNIELKVNVTFGTWPLRHSIEDTYQIEWVGLDRSPNPPVQIHAWNKRNDLYIYKLSRKGN